VNQPAGLDAGLPRGLLILLGLAAATVAVTGLRLSAGLVGPAFLALVLTIAVHPVRGWLRERGVPGWVATLAVLVGVYAVIVGLALSLLVAGARFAALLPSYQQEFLALFQDAMAALERFGVGEEQIQTMSSAFDLGRLAGLMADVLGSLFSVLSNLVFIITLLLFMSLDAAWFPARLAEARLVRGQVVEALESFARGTRTYLVVSTAFGLIVAVIDTGVLWALGIPVPLLWGLLAFITNYIPNVGFVIGLIPPAALGLLEGGPGLMLAVIVAYSVINVVIQSVIQPKIVGDAVGLSTTVTFLSLVFWAWILGALGALLAIPLSLLAKALLVDVDPSAGWMRPLISGGRTVPTPPRT